MATLQFQVHVDKENTGAFGAVPKSKSRHASVSGIRGKSFHSSNTPSLTTPRKVLGDVNKTRDTVFPGKTSGSFKPQSFKPAEKKPTGTLSLQKNEEKKKTPLENRAPGLKQKQPLASRQGNVIQQKESEKKHKSQMCAPDVMHIPVKSRVPEVEDIEKMHIPKECEDDFEDIWPKKDRISSYLDKLISWRPPCFFGEGPVSDEEAEDERKMERIIHQLDSLPKPKEIDEEPPILPEDLLEPEPLDDIPFPFIDDTVLPSLEDSYSTVPTLGTLELKDESFSTTPALEKTVLNDKSFSATPVLKPLELKDD